MLPEFAVIMLMVSAIVVLASVVAVQMGAKKMQVFMKVLKAVIGLNVVIGILDIVALIIYFV